MKFFVAINRELQPLARRNTVFAKGQGVTSKNDYYSEYRIPLTSAISANFMRSLICLTTGP
jgi:hypothetical protein